MLFARGGCSAFSVAMTSAYWRAFSKASLLAVHSVPRVWVRFRACTERKADIGDQGVPFSWST